MVFNARESCGRCQLNNGYYYVLADTEWRVDIGTIVDSYPCRVPNYVVYELQLAEAQVRFFSADGKERLLSASRYSGIKLENVWYTPGVTYDGMPVGKGLKKGSLLPYLAVSRTLLESGEPDLTLELYHNGRAAPPSGNEKGGGAVWQRTHSPRRCPRFGKAYTSRLALRL